MRELGWVFALSDCCWVPCKQGFVEAFLAMRDWLIVPSNQSVCCGFNVCF